VNRVARPAWPLVPLALLGAAFLVLPILGLLQRAPWTDLPDLLSSSVVTDALGLSLVTSLLATAISIVVGLPLAVVLARGQFRGRSILRALVVLPMVLPPVVGGATSSASSFRSPPPGWSSRRRSWPCPSW
jgi:molybdate transport system permease protein